ncbi:hypothetical protein J2853_002924 [Streptosporangium lutulentum]|uniref:Uncharacterized protein n=1 Tax=Streptosporangium lutulentum TaxID=1461250 RepID=A0ABT9QAD0_9ACTN|nr:hypothetical protein [Streptosporangium lutulentum]
MIVYFYPFGLGAFEPVEVQVGVCPVNGVRREAL